MGGLEGSRAAFWVQEGQASTARGASQVHSNVQSLDTTPGVDGMYTLLCVQGLLHWTEQLGLLTRHSPSPLPHLFQESVVQGSSKRLV